jgi:ribosomal protein L21
MKYAIVEISGRQFWIETGKYYDFNRILQIR